MLQTRRTAVRLSPRLCYRQQQRYESKSSYANDTPSGHAASAGRAEPTHHAPHPEPVNESLGRGFYITLAAIPLSFAFYKFSRSTEATTGDSALFTRLIRKYTSYKLTWTERNTLHTDMIEQAAHDRNLFQSSPGSKMIDLKFPEIFNTGSPYNVQAGQSANLDALIAHYEKQNAERQAQQMKKLEGGNKEPDPDEIVRRATY
ncbi:MAG: hypothetical protein Q9187_004298 [Circinaria calcarea]